MIPFLFFTLCVMYSGGEDCSYTWAVLPDIVFDEIYNIYKDNEKFETKDVMGFTVASERSIFARDSTDVAYVLAHEAKHALCNVEFLYEYGEETNLMLCHFMIDIVYLVKPAYQESDARVNPIPIPEMSQKMAYTTYSMPIGITQEYYDEMKARNFK